MKARILAAVLLLAVAAQAAEPAASTRKFWNKKQVFGLVLNVGLRSLDAGITCHNLMAGGREFVYPTQSCGGVVAFSMGAVGGELATAFVLHHFHRDRLETINPYAWAAPAAAGAAYSFANSRDYKTGGVK